MATKKEKIVDWKIVCFALACITALGITALINGINGTILTIVIGVLAGIAGYVMPSPIKLKS